jgi:16S rRNA (uracil1498-N3)-methyltransferase
VKQFLLAKEPDDGVVRLDGDDYRYLVRVRRLAPGEFFPALLPGGEKKLIQVLSVEKGLLTGKCVLVEPSPDSPSPSIPAIVLFQALPKGEKMDVIVRQAAEGGITEIVPFVSEFSVAKANAGGQKFSRWQRIIREARQQCGSKTATAIRHPLSKDELIEYWKELKRPCAHATQAAHASQVALGLLFHHQGLENKSLHSYLDSSYLDNVPEVIVIAIGPEGGFSGAEVSLFLENGFNPITIGDTILRTETAALYCAAAVRTILLERDSWQLKQK